LNTLINLFDFEAATKGVLPDDVRDYICGGATDEVTLRENRAAFDQWRIHYRVLRGAGQRDLSTELFGTRIDWPVVIAPTAHQTLAHAEGEAATSRAASSAGTIMTLSTLSNHAMEAVAREAGRGLWFQLYVHRDRGVTRELIARAVASGARAIVLTVDAATAGLRERDLRNGFRFPPREPMEGVTLVPTQGATFQAYVNATYDPALSWKDLEWLCSHTSLPVLVKGIVRPDDAVLAADHGARGVVVSNHGGRQLDTAPPTIDVLEPVVQAVGSRVTVLLDSGIRRGTDVLKALALGARAVMLGRPVLWGLAVGGETGVRRVLDLLRNELDVAMALAGCSSLADVDRSLVQRAAK
jgi:4-hydroxymandelate oxidase